MSNEGAKKKGKAPGDKKPSKRKAKRRETYAVYIYKVLKQVRIFINHKYDQRTITKL